MKNKNTVLIFILLGTALLAAACLAVMTGPVVIKPLLVIKIWVHQLGCGLIDKDWTRIPEVIVLDVRTPRVVLAILVGMGLSVSGAAMQG
ncbi:MAG: iron chelate uptake ABC transporter family permease subunit, partial [Proteobacteria bacterium]|nr:iron chelate uptake ABC transporter family permease subunit [Pseudomonadota bacterium]